MRIAFGAYAISPLRGSEAGMSWRVATGLAEAGHDVHVITSRRYSEEWDTAEHPAGLTIHTVTATVPRLLDKGLAGVYLRYLAHLRAASRHLQQLHRQTPFDIAHHYSWGSLFWGTRLWRASIPTVFGPIGGGSFSPACLAGLYSRKDRQREQLRQLVTQAYVASRLARRSLRRVHVIAANSDTADLVARSGIPRPPQKMIEPTAPDLLRTPLPTEPRQQRSVVWVGRLLPRKGISLALQVMTHLPPSFTLTIVGDGPQKSTAEAEIAALGLVDRVTVTGWVPWTQVVGHLDRAQVMLFTSIRDTIGTQLFEAAARGVPIVGIQHQGVGDYIPSTAGRLVPLDTPEVLAGSLARAIGHVVAPDVWGSLSRGARQLAERYSPEGCATDLEREYQRFLGPETPTGAASSAFRHRTEGRS